MLCLEQNKISMLYDTLNMVLYCMLNLVPGYPTFLVIQTNISLMEVGKQGTPPYVSTQSTSGQIRDRIITYAILYKVSLYF